MTPAIEESRCELAAEVLLANRTLTLKAFGTSMLPTLWPGDLTHIQSCSFDEVHPGDIVLCRTNSRFSLHRVTRKVVEGADSWLITRGDSMPGPDPRVSSANVLGKVIEVQHASRDFIVVPKFSTKSRVIGRILGHSTLCMRFVMKLHGPSPQTTDLSLGETTP
jgi:signal peptidase I